MKAETEKPETQRVKAIDVKPGYWALWCSIEDGKPFANTITNRRWSEDGTKIWFMLDSHNFISAKAEEELELVPRSPDVKADLQAAWDAEDECEMFHLKVAGKCAKGCAPRWPL